MTRMTLTTLVPTVLDYIQRLWCRTFHDSFSRPVNGAYKCWKCGNEWKMEWGMNDATRRRVTQPGKPVKPLQPVHTVNTASKR